MLKFAVQIRIRFFNLLPSLGRNFTLQLLEGAVLALAVASGSHQDLWHYNQSSGYLFNKKVQIHRLYENFLIIYFIIWVQENSANAWKPRLEVILLHLAAQPFLTSCCNARPFGHFGLQRPHEASNHGLNSKRRIVTWPDFRIVTWPVTFGPNAYRTAWMRP